MILVKKGLKTKTEVTENMKYLQYLQKILNVVNQHLVYAAHLRSHFHCVIYSSLEIA